MRDAGKPWNGSDPARRARLLASGTCSYRRAVGSFLLPGVGLLVGRRSRWGGIGDEKAAPTKAVGCTIKGAREPKWKSLGWGAVCMRSIFGVLPCMIAAAFSAGAADGPP